jgi:tetratricopeptide (TPR) repeat protein
MNGRNVLVPARINGIDAQFVVGSNSFWSMLSLAATRQYRLSVNYSRAEGIKLRGAGEAISVGVTKVKDLTLFGVPFKYMDFVVISEQLDQAAVGIIGQNLLGVVDADYDLGHGRLRIFNPKHCEKQTLAWWAAPTDKVSVVPMERTYGRWALSSVAAYLDGEKIRVSFDTASSVSIVTLAAARRAGLTPDSAGVEPGGSMPGEGGRMLETWIGRFKSFKIGDEEVRNARLRFADIATSSDMLLGADFFLSHRIMLSTSQHQVYFTYEGGPVFDLRTRPKTQAAAAASTVAQPDQEEEPQDAAGFAGRGMGYAARGMYDRALEDLDRACTLAPDNVGYRLTRGETRWRAHRVDAALEDLDHVLQAQPANTAALLAHAVVTISRRDYAAATADLDRLDTILPPASEQRIDLARLNTSARRPASSIPQLDQWIPLHPDDRDLPDAFNSRCWARALVGRNGDSALLDAAIKDCNAALRSQPELPNYLDSRGLVYLRMGKWDLAIADYDAALAGNPKQAWSLYGRGIARIRKGSKADGQADIDAASAIDAHVAEDAGYYGIAP